MKKEDSKKENRPDNVDSIAGAANTNVLAHRKQYSTTHTDRQDKPVPTSNPEDMSAPTINDKISFSVITKKEGILTKKLSLNNAEIDKDGSQCRLGLGTIKTYRCTPESFAKGLPKFDKNMALVHGVPEHEEAVICSQKRFDAVKKNTTDKPVITRTKDHLSYPDGPGLMMFDHDKARDNAVGEHKALKSYRPSVLRFIVSSVHPAFKGAAYVSTPSTSSCIYDKDGNQLRGEGDGFHMYVFPKIASDIPRYLETLGKRLILAGYGRIEISRAGSLLIRTLVDLSVGSPERLDFVAGAVCEDGLEQRLPAPYHHPGGLLDTTTLLDLTDAEEEKYNKVIQELKDKAKPQQKIIRESYINIEADKLSKSKNIDIDTARAIIRSRQDHILEDTDLLYFAHNNGKIVTVAEVLDDGANYDGMSLADPLEPEYDGGSMTKAKFFWNNGKPIIHSYAHGSIKYRFKRFEKEPIDINGADSPYPKKTIVKLNEMNQEFASCLLGGKYRIIKESYDHSQKRHDISFLEITSFNNFFSNKKVLVKKGDGHESKSIAKVWQEWKGRRTYDNVVFNPGNNTPKHSYNLFRGFPLKPKKGDWSLMENHLRVIICDGDSDLYDYLISWMARAVQYPGGKRPGVAIVMKGGKGVGKGLFANYFGKIFGEAFLPISTSKGFTGNFNAHLSNCLVVFLDEAVWGGDKQAEGQLKALITEPTMLFEAKGIDSMPLQSFINVIMASNEDWVCPATVDERRFCVLSPSSARQGDTVYFDDLCDQMDNGGVEAMYHDLMQQPYDMGILRKAPHTAGLVEQVTQSLNPVLKFWHSVLFRGFLLSNRDTGAPIKALMGKASDDWPDKAWKYEVYNEFKNNFSRGGRNIKTDKAFWTETWKFWKNGKAGQTRPQLPDGSRKHLLEIDNCESMQNAFTKYTGIEF